MGCQKYWMCFVFAWSNILGGKAMALKMVVLITQRTLQFSLGT